MASGQADLTLVDMLNRDFELAEGVTLLMRPEYQFEDVSPQVMVFFEGAVVDAIQDFRPSALVQIYAYDYADEADLERHFSKAFRFLLNRAYVRQVESVTRVYARRDESAVDEPTVEQWDVIVSR